MGAIQGWMPSEAQWLQFCKKLKLTTHKVDSSTSTNEINFDKIYVLATHHTDVRGLDYYLYNIDLIDLSTCKDYDDSIQPMLQFGVGNGCLDYYRYVVVGTKLFMIGGYNYEKKTWMDWFSWYDFRGAMHYDTATYVKKKYLTRGPPMEGKKHTPYAAVIGGDKICVFSSLLYDKKAAESGYPSWGPPNFEVFNTLRRSWTKLPEIETNYSKYKLDRICIRSYCIERSCLIVCTDIGIHGIKVDDDHLKWVQMDGSKRIEGSPFVGSWVMVGEKVCSPYEVLGWGEVETSSFALTECGQGVLCKEIVNNGVILCGVYGRVEPETRVRGRVKPRYGVPILSVNVIKFDGKLLEKSRGDMWNIIKCDKSSIFEIKSQSCEHMELKGCWFQFKETHETEKSEDEQMELMSIFPFQETEKSKDEEMEKREDENDPAVENNVFEDKKARNSTQFKYRIAPREMEESSEDKNDPAVENDALEDNKVEKNSTQFKETEKVEDERMSKMVDSVIVLGSLIAVLLYATVC